MNDKITVGKLTCLSALKREIILALQTLDSIAAQLERTESDDCREALQEYGDLMRERVRMCNAEAERLESYIDDVQDPLTREIMILHFSDGLSWGETAKALGGANTYAGVRQRVYRQVNADNADIPQSPKRARVRA